MVPMENSFLYIPNLSQPPLEPPKDSIVSKVLLKDADLEVTLFAFDAGQGLNEHTSSFPALIEIIDGEGSMTLDGREVRLTKGSWVYMKPNTPHSLTANKPLKMLLTLRK